MVTAGPTHEAIDPVRFIANHSSGKMGIAIAEEFANRGAHVTLIAGPSKEQVSGKIHVLKVTSARQMFEECVNIFPNADYTVMAAAVADYTPEQVSSKKIKKDANSWKLHLKKTSDVLTELGKQKKNGQVLVGFALETNNEKQNALLKLKEKNCDIIILNSLSDEGAGFDGDTNKISIFDKHGNEYLFDKKTKKQVAADIVNTVVNYAS